MEVGMRDTPNMPELGKDRSSGAMHRVRDLSPTGHLFVRMDSGRADVADALRTDLRGFGDDQTGRCSLAVISYRQRIGHIGLDSAAARHWRHHHSVRKDDVPQT